MTNQFEDSTLDGLSQLGLSISIWLRTPQLPIFLLGKYGRLMLHPKLLSWRGKQVVGVSLLLRN